jgi:transcriptional regulator with PAS, ATPase and Fis domain
MNKKLKQISIQSKKRMMKNINKCLTIFGILYHRNHYIKEFKKYQIMNRKQMKKDIQNMKQVQLYKVIKKESRQKKKKIKMVKKKEMKKIMGRKERKVKMGEM